MKFYFAIIFLAHHVMCNKIITSTDQMQLKFVPYVSMSPLHGLPASGHQFQFELRNNGPSAMFQLSQMSEHGFLGNLFPASIFVEKSTYKTITVTNLLVPQVAIGTIIPYTLKAVKDGQSLTNTQTEVTASLEFTVGSPPSDMNRPSAWKEFGGTCPVTRNSTQCSSYQWNVEYHVMDKESGILNLEVSAEGKDSFLHPVQYRMPNFPIGTKQQIDITIDTNCCVAGIRLKAKDLLGNEVDLLSFQDDNGSSIKRLSIGMFAISLLSVWLVN